jgi:hypothetical protein
MAYRLERAKNSTLEVELGNEIVSIPVGGMKVYKNVLQAQSRLRDIQTKIDTFQKNNKEITKELVDFLGESVITMFQSAFGEEITDKILTYYEGNYDEMLLKVYPFFTGVFLPALKENARLESREYAKRLTGAS